jgi:hypothetical protein
LSGSELEGSSSSLFEISDPRETFCGSDHAEHETAGAIEGRRSPLRNGTTREPPSALAHTRALFLPDAAHEALRDLVRAREAAKKDQLRARHRLAKFLLRQGRGPPEGTEAWTLKYLAWVKRDVRFEQHRRRRCSTTSAR